jgi:hypothetical protein
MSSCVREHIKNNIIIDTTFFKSLSFLNKRLFDKSVVDRPI